MDDHRARIEELEAEVEDLLVERDEALTYYRTMREDRDRLQDLAHARQRKLEGAVARIAEADRLLRVVYAGAHSEDVPVDVLMWLNPDTPGGRSPMPDRGTSGDG